LCHGEIVRNVGPIVATEVSARHYTEPAADCHCPLAAGCEGVRLANQQILQRWLDAGS
jgi:hypothetical protein